MDCNNPNHQDHPNTKNDMGTGGLNPPNNVAHGANQHAPTTQGTYGYQQNSRHGGSGFNYMPSISPNYQHVQGMPNYVSNSQFMGPFSPRQAHNPPSNLIDPALSGSPGISNSFENLLYSNDLSVPRRTAFKQMPIPPLSEVRHLVTISYDDQLAASAIPALPVEQNSGARSKRQDTNDNDGTRVVSLTKRQKRQSTDNEDDTKIGERDIQTAQPRYSAYSNHFDDPGQARTRLTALQWKPPTDPLFPIPITAQQMLPYVIRVYDAMVDSQSGFYDKQNSCNRLLEGKYPQERIEATAWLIIDDACSLHRGGCHLLPTADPTCEQKGKKNVFHEDRLLTFRDRVQEICDTFRLFKSACCEALDGAKTYKIVYGPTKIRERTKNNAISNDRRAKKSRALSGDTDHKDLEPGEDQDSARAQVTIDESIPQTPIFTTQRHGSLADPQDISPSKAKPFPPSVPELPRTPRRPQPAAFQNVRAFTTPAPTLHDYETYNYNNYSVGQPGRTLNQESYAAGADILSEQGNAAKEHEWLRTRRTEDH